MDIQAFLANYRAERARDIAQTEIDVALGWELSHHNRIVFYCPACATKIGADLDTSAGPQPEMEQECEACGVTIRLILSWRLEPDLIQVFATTSPAAAGAVSTQPEA